MPIVNNLAADLIIFSKNIHLPTKYVEICVSGNRVMRGLGVVFGQNLEIFAIV